MSTAPEDHLDVALSVQSLKTRSVRGAAAIFVAQALKFIIRFATTIILARLLVPADFGLVAMVTPIVALAQMLNEAGLTQAIVQRQDITKGQLSALFWLVLLIGLAIAGLLLAGAPIVSFIYKEPATAQILVVLAGLAVLTAAGMVPTALLTRAMRFGLIAGIDVLTTIANVLVSLTLAWSGYGYWSLIYGLIAASVLNLLLVFAAAGWLPERPRIIKGVGPLLRFGANLTGANIATYLMATADNMIVGAAVGKTGLGIYDRCYSLVLQPLSQIVGPVGRVAIPLLSRLGHDSTLYRGAFIDMLRICLLLTTPGMLFSIIFAEPAILYVLGERWRAAIPVFAWLCVGGLAVPVFLASTWLFVSQGRAASQLRYTTVTSVISVASFAIGVIWGILGVAVVSAISFAAIQTPIIVWGATRSGSVGLADLTRAVLPLLAGGLVTSSILLLLPFEWTLPSLGASLAVSYGVFAFVAYLLPGGRALFGRLMEIRSLFRAGGL